MNGNVGVLPAVRTLLTGAVDYAGLFPPAQLPMPAAVYNFAHYGTLPFAWMLGRFIVPAPRLAEFTQQAETLVVTKLCGVIPVLQEGLPFLVSPKMGGVQPNGTIDAGEPGNWCAECWYVKAQ